MPIPNIPPALPMPIANSGDVSDIPVTTPTGTGQLSFQAGFPFITQVPLLAGGIAPSRPDFNAVMKLLSQHAFFAQSGGVYPWQGADGDFAGLNYLAGWHVMGSDGREYIARLPSGPDVPATGGGFVGPKDPISNSDYWKPTSTTPSLAQVTAYYTAGTISWTVPDINGDGTPWQGFIRIKGSGNGGEAAKLSGLRCGGYGGGEGCTVLRFVTFTPGDVHTLTVGAGGAGQVTWTGSPPVNGQTTSFGTITSAPGGNGVRGGVKNTYSDEIVILGAAGGLYGTAISDTNYYQCLGGIGGGGGAITSSNPTGTKGLLGSGGTGGLFPFNSASPQVGGAGGDGFIEIYKVG